MFVDLEDDSCKLLEVKELLSSTSLPIKSDKLLNVSETMAASGFVCTLLMLDFVIFINEVDLT